MFNKLKFAAAVAVMCMVLRFAVHTVVERALANSADATLEFQARSDAVKLPEIRNDWNSSDSGGLLGNQSNTNRQNRE